MSQTLWVEKYRPQEIADCVLPPLAQKEFESFVASGEMPHLMLHGPAGIGKTTIAKALAKAMNYDMMIMNASNSRGIEVLRNEITAFATSASIDGNMKMVILDEFDNATPDLQKGMRAAMEDFSKTTRFVFTCNFPNKIISPLHSRCAVFDFSIKNEDKIDVVKKLFKRIINILTAENVKFDQAVVGEIVKHHFPDFRRIINECQRVASVAGEITESSIVSYDIDVNDFVGFLKTKNFKGARQWIVETMVNQDVHTIFRAVYDNMYDVLEPTSIPDAVLLIATYQNRCMASADPEIQMAAFSVEAMMSLNFK
jgi:DNA polymerase III delta prime subunit